MIRTARHTLSFIAIVLLLGTLSACGKKSAPTPTAEPEYTKQYPRR